MSESTQWGEGLTAAALVHPSNPRREFNKRLAVTAQLNDQECRVNMQHE